MAAARLLAYVEQLEPPGPASVPLTLDTRLAGPARALPGEPGRELATTQLSDQPDVLGLCAGEPPAVRERAHLLDGQPAAARDGLDELPQHVVDHLLEQGALLAGQTADRGADVLERPTLDDGGIHAELLRQGPDVRELHDGADRPGEGPRAGHDRRGSGGDVVRRRRRGVPERRDHRLGIAQRADRVVALLRARDAAAG